MKKINNNSGFTLVELIIAIAVLAFLMTAVGSLMGSSVLSHKKAKAEIRVHTSAQETYNQLTDSIMQANEIVIIGYETSSPIDFKKPGDALASTPDLYYYVKDNTMKQFIIANPNVYGTTGAQTSNVKLFSEISDSSYIYAKKLVIKNSVNLDISKVPGANPSSVTNTVTDGIFGGNKTAKRVKYDSAGRAMYDLNDNVLCTYSFDKNNMYYERRYSYMTSLNSYSATGMDMEDYIFNAGFNYVSTGPASATVPVSGCLISVNSDEGSIGVVFNFYDKNMTYTTDGMVSVRNSYVLKAKDN